VISWRYHLVSIIAVFLALALGVLAGTTVVNQGLINTLKTRTDAADQKSAEYRKSLTATTTELADYTDAFVQASEQIEALRLSTLNVVIVADGSADHSALAQVDDALSNSGANVVTTLVPLPLIASTDPADVKSLAEDVGVPAQTDPSTLPGLVATKLAIRLAQGPPSTAHPGAPPDILANLLLQGFIDSRNPGVKVANDIGVPDAVVVVGGPTEGAAVPPATFMVPLVKELSSQNLVVAAGEARQSPDGFVSLVRSDGAGAGPRVTVDDLENSLGGTALVVGLQRAIDQRVGGDYGTATGLQILPPLS
jgi:copper transport outer membrane protein MctB